MYGIYLAPEKFSLDITDGKHIIDINFDPKIFTVLEINKKHYVVRMINHKDKVASVNEVNFKTEPEEEFNDDWICPYCGYLDNDAFELADSEDERECLYCGSIVAYEKVVTVEYRVKPVKKAAITKIQ